MNKIKKQEPEVIQQDDREKKSLILQQEIHVGPLPHPIIFEQYETALPGSAERILKMAEKEQDSRLEDQRDKRKIEKRGQIFGCLIVVTGLVIGWSMILLGKSLEGMIITAFFAGLIGLARLFVQKEVKREKNAIESKK